jgi:hypothetical protein
MKTIQFFALFLILPGILFTGCKKDLLVEPDTGLEIEGRNITLEEIMAIYGDYNTAGSIQFRSGARLPLNVTPEWNGAYSYSRAPMPVILTTIDTSCLYQDNRYGGNLAFFKDSLGVIQSLLLLWRADSLTEYSSNRAPLDSTSNFSGMITVVDDQDKVKKITRLNSGIVIRAKVGSTSIYDIIPEEGLDDGGIDFRGPGGPKCYRWGRNRDIWDILFGWVGGALEWLGGIFEGQVWDDANGEHIYYGAGAFIFGWGGGAGGNGYIIPGGASVTQQEFADQMTTCLAIQDYLLSFGEMPSGYSQADLLFCQLSIDLGLSGDQSFCLYAFYGSSYLNDLHSYWEASDKSLATADRMKAYINSKCSGGYAALLTDLIHGMFCLTQHPIDLMEKIKNQCGFSSYEGSEWANNFNNGLSNCVKEVIVQERVAQIQAEYGLSLSADNIAALSNSNCFFSCAFGTCAVTVKNIFSSIAPALGLNQSQINYLLANTDLAEEMHAFLNEEEWTAEAITSAGFVFKLIFLNEYNGPYGAVFQQVVNQYGDLASNPNLGALITLEAAILKAQHPDWSNFRIGATATLNVLLEELHLILDIGGLVPGAEICDLINGAIYTLQGDKFNAKLSFLAAIPFAGWPATGIKWAQKAVVGVSGRTYILKFVVEESTNLIKFGDRNQLRRILKTPSGHQAHHIVPWGKTDHPVIQKAASAGSDKAQPARIKTSRKPS